MLKSITLAVVALLCFASQSFARHPYVYDPVAGVPSVLVRADAPAADAPAAPVDAAIEAAAKENSEASADSLEAKKDVTAPATQPVTGDASAAQSVVVDSAPVAQPVASPTSSEYPVAQSVDGAIVGDSGHAVVTSDSAPVYRSVRPARRQSGLVGELIELERRKNAWIRRNLLNR